MNFMFTTPKANALAVTEQLLRLLNVKVTASSIKQNIENHPDQLSIMAIADCLNAFNIVNYTYDVKEEDCPTEMLYPFVAHIKPNGGNFLLVYEITSGKVIYSNEQKERAIMTEEEFLKIWSRVALHAEPTPESGEANYAQNRTAEILKSLLAPTTFLSLVIMVYLSFEKQDINWHILTLIVLKFSGIGISILLLMQSLNANNPFIKNLCTLNGKNDCNAILKSDAAKVTSWLTWSEVGFFYFTGSLLSLLFAPLSLPLLVWLNLLALPYTIYSIIYQYRNKNWCILCCSVQVLLVLEVITFLASGISFSLFTASFELSTIASLALVFLLSILTWSFLKPFFTDASQIKSLKNQLKKFKYNSELFNQALKNQPCYAVPDDLMPIVLGNPNAATTITMVSNPFCGPCAKAHETLDQWLKTRDDIRLKIIFTTSSHDDDEKTKVSRHVSALSLLNDAKLLENAINDWYKQGDKKYSEWAKKYPINITGEMTGVTDKQKEWCGFTEIISTPTILVNGYKLPDPYLLEDIKHLLD